MHNELLNIFLENTSSYVEKREIQALYEADASNNIDNATVSRLYGNIVNKSHIDFGDIPVSKGDFTKYSGYESIVEIMAIMDKLAGSSNIQVPQLQVIHKAIDNVVALKDIFVTGFKLDKEFVILQYNVLVLAIVEAVSGIISSYVDYIKKIDAIEMVIINPKTSPAQISINNLAKFNSTVASGDFIKVCNMINKTGNKNFTGAIVVIPALIIIGLVTVIILLREMVYYAYNLKMKISTYAAMQASFLELNKTNIEGSTSLNPQQKKQVLKKQEKLVKDLKAISDKLVVKSTLANNETKQDIKSENKSLDFNDIKSAGASSDNTGFSLL